MSVVTVQQDLNLFERDQPLLYHFINFREKRVYLFRAINYLDYDR